MVVAGPVEMVEQALAGFIEFSLDPSWEAVLDLSCQFFLNQLSVVAKGNPSHDAADSHI